MSSFSPPARPMPHPATDAIRWRSGWAALAPQSSRTALPALFLAPSIALSGLGYLNGGVPRLADAGFLWMTCACAVLLVRELMNFRRNQGWGAATLYFGVLVWFCHDYLKHWNTTFLLFGWDGQWARDYPDALPTVAKMAFLHCLFVTLMAVGLGWRVPDRAIRWIRSYPEPKNLDLLLWIALGTLLVNLGFYYLFSNAGRSLDGFAHTIYSLYFGGRRGQVGTTVGFGGNLTTNFSGYLIMLAGTIGIGGHAAAAYLVFARSCLEKKLLAGLVWGHAMMMAYGGGTRSILVCQAASMGVFLVIHMLHHPETFRRFFLVLAGLALLIAGGIQLQSHYRNQAYDIDLSDKRLTSEIVGNTMFSEALDAYVEIPQHQPFFHNSYPGEGALRALPQMGFWFALAPVPRPLLKMMDIEKPVDPAWAFRARTGDTAQETNLATGTTSSFGLVGAWYLRFGIVGMMEGALLMGWLYAATERLIRSVTFPTPSILRLVIGLTALTTLLMFFRDVVFIALWPAILTFVLLAIILRALAPRMVTAT